MNMPPVITPEEVEKALSVAKLLKKHVDKQFTIKQICDCKEIQPYKMQFLFKKLFGKTIAEYVVDQKMKEALRLVIQTQEPIKNIAGSVGYKKGNHFSEAFKKHFHYAPSHLRKRNNLLPGIVKQITQIAAIFCDFLTFI